MASKALQALFASKSQPATITYQVPAVRYSWDHVFAPRLPSVIHLPSFDYLTGVHDYYWQTFDDESLLPDDFILQLLEKNDYYLEKTVDAMYEAEEALRGTPEQQEEWKRLAEDERILNEYLAFHNEQEPIIDEDTIDDSDVIDDLQPARPTQFRLESLDIDRDFHLDPSQEAAVIGLSKEKHGCLIGAAGTGKTTTTKVLVNTLMYGNPAWDVKPLRLSAVDVNQYMKKVKESSKKPVAQSDEDKDKENSIIPSIAMVAFTGQATQVLKKNLPRSWAKNVMTIHLLLGYIPSEYVDQTSGKTKFRFEPSYTKYNKMPWDVIIIDETSMVSVDLWHKLLDASKPGCRFYFIGDLNQLPPPIGVGILGFALSKWPVFELTVVHRQKEEAANRIVDAAHRILKGEMPEWDDYTKPGWRVSAIKIQHAADVAKAQIIKITKMLADTPMGPGMPGFYNPFRDRIMVPMNGGNPNSADEPIGQLSLNDTLSTTFADKGSERYIIDAKRQTKKFAVGYRIMATKNESPAMEDRVTNGMTGRIVGIEENPEYDGRRDLVGLESVVAANRQRLLMDLEGRHKREAEMGGLGQALDSFNFNMSSPGAAVEEERQGGPSSHIVTVQFDNGALRVYRNNAQVESLYLAYASTVHKAQGAEMPMAIVVIHHLQKRMLNRELLYTAITRASERVLVLYTDMGMQVALRAQRISGNTLEQKIKQYQELLGEVVGRFVLNKMEVRLELSETDTMDDIISRYNNDDEDEDDFQPSEDA